MKTQHGTLTKKSGNWLGHYSKWILDEHTGEKSRIQKAFVIAPVDGTTKFQARQKLKERIEQELGLRSDSRVTLKWFIEHRWQPLHEGQWRPSTKATNLWVLGHIIAKLGNVPLEKADSVDLQRWLNGLAKTHSGSLVKHCRTFLKSIFSEAVEQDYVRKSPARLLRIPDLKPIEKPFLSLEQIKKLLDKAEGMDRTLLRLLLVTGLRPSELFALTWKSFDPDKKLLHITESIYRGKIRPYTKTTDKNSRSSLQIVFLPDMLVTELKALHAEEERLTSIVAEKLGQSKASCEEEYIFAGEYGSAQWKENYHQNRSRSNLGAGPSTFSFMRSHMYGSSFRSTRS
jgi:integrase